MRDGIIKTITKVQPHGALLVLRLPEWVITHASESLLPIFGVEAHEIIGRPIGDLMSRHTIHRLRNIMQFVVANGEPERLMNLAMGFKRERFDLSIYADQNRAVIEIKPRQTDQKNIDDAFFLLRAMRARIRNAASVAEACLRTARQCRSLTGYDRATILRFRKDGTSEVMADERRDGIAEPGFMYQASKARSLMRALVEGARFTYLPDTDYAGSPIVPEPVPLGEFHGRNSLGLRGIAPEQADYLRRYGVGALFALPIGPLFAPWGAVICQNAEPRFIPFEVRSALEFFLNGVGLQVALLNSVDALGKQNRAREVRAEILDDTEMTVDPGENLQGFAEALGRHIAVDGAGYWNGEAFTSVGEAPSAQEGVALAARFKEASPTVQTVDEGSGAVRGGVLAVRLSREPDQYLMLFRKSAPRAWGGVEIEAGHALRSLILGLRLRRMDSNDEGQRALLRRQETVIAELNHRIKNLLALFQSLVAKTGESADTLDEFAASLAGRVGSLAMAHDQINGNDISGAQIRLLIETELAPYMSMKTDIEIDGPDLALSPQAFTVMALVMHELATNAAKHGALGEAGGAVKIGWQRSEDGGVRIDWRERSAAPILPPAHRGFGSTIIERMIPFELRGAARVSYPPEGLSASFDVPAHFVTENATGFSRLHRQPDIHIALDQGRTSRALVVEDNMLIALQAEDMLLRLGFSHVDIVARWQEAARLLDDENFDVATLDVSLAEETSFPLADKLVAAGIPFIFATGYDDRRAIPDRFAHVPIVPKPYSETSLASAMAAFFGTRD